VSPTPNRAELTVDAVVFDLDGTLVDSMMCAPQAYADTLRALGGQNLSVNDVLAEWHIGPTSVVLEHFLGRPVGADDLACFAQRFEAAVAVVRPFDGVVAMLDAMARDERRLAVYTTATKWAAELMLAVAGLQDRFSSIVGGDDVTSPKPAPDGLELACQQLGVVPSSACYVGDAAVDLECAKAAGALPIHAAWGGRPVVPGNHLVAHCPLEIVELLRR